MDLTASYEVAFDVAVVDRYDWCEVRNAASILRTTNPSEFGDLAAALDEFAVLVERDIAPAGGNESLTAAALNSAFRQRGWQEASFDVQVTSTLSLKGSAVADPAVVTSAVSSPSYLVDNVRGRVALDVEWHAKDGNLDRDIAAYRSLYDAGVIDAAVMVTQNRADMRAWAVELDPHSRKFATSTTTNLEKVRPRLTRGDGGGCPILVVAICRRTV